MIFPVPLYGCLPLHVLVKGFSWAKYCGGRWRYISPATEKHNFISDGRDTAEEVRRAADPESYFVTHQDRGGAGGIFQSIQDWLW